MLANASQRDQWAGIDDERHVLGEGRFAGGFSNGYLALQISWICIKVRQMTLVQQIEELGLRQTQKLGGLAGRDLALLKELKEHPLPGLPPQLRLRDIQSCNQLFRKLDLNLQYGHGFSTLADSSSGEVH